MRAMKSPFLLIADQRLEGGDFYVGTKEYETMIQDKILEVMDEFATEKEISFDGPGAKTPYIGNIFLRCFTVPLCPLDPKPCR